MELVRNLLLEMEASEQQFLFVSRAIGRAAEPRDYHLDLMRDAGLLAFANTSGSAYRMTWQGHDFLDSVRDPEIWRRTLESAESAKGFTFDLLRDLAKGFIRTKLKEHTGVDI
jgi:hypothetical protein